MTSATRAVLDVNNEYVASINQWSDPVIPNGHSRFPTVKKASDWEPSVGRSQSSLRAAPVQSRQRVLSRLCSLYIDWFALADATGSHVCLSFRVGYSLCLPPINWDAGRALLGTRRFVVA